MADQERKDQQQAPVTPEQQPPRIDDLAHPEVSKDEASQTKGGGMLFGQGLTNDEV